MPEIYAFRADLRPSHFHVELLALTTDGQRRSRPLGTLQRLSGRVQRHVAGIAAVNLENLVTRPDARPLGCLVGWARE